MPDHVPPRREPVLEPAARELAEATAPPPFPFDKGPVRGRTALEKTQSAAHDKPEMDDRWVAVSGGPKGSVAVRILRPKGAVGTLPAILYIHGAGRVFGSAYTHDRLVRELAVGAQAVLVLPEYTLSPEARCPTGGVLRRGTVGDAPITEDTGSAAGADTSARGPTDVRAWRVGSGPSHRAAASRFRTSATRRIW
ncbi:alpha/beta hydrolase fold domain-containing protein [Streptomyces sp. NPDC005133]